VSRSGNSKVVPVKWLCDPANWAYVSGQLRETGVGLPAGYARDTDSSMAAVMMVALDFRHRYRLRLDTPLAALVPPSVWEGLGQGREYMERAALTVHSFGVERDLVAVVDPDRFRYFDNGSGWWAKFTLEHPGVLVSEAQA
jgi:hypothetical protein